MSVAAPTLTGTHVQLEQLSRRVRRGARRGRQRRQIHIRLDTGAADRRGHAALHRRPARRSAGAHAPCRSRSAGSATAPWSAAPATCVWSGGAATTLPDEVEIGGTWLAASAQRTPINTEAKYLLLSNAFDDVERAPRRRSAPTRATRRAEPRSCGSAPRSRASCAAIAARMRPGEENIGRPRFGDVLGDPQRLAGGQARPGRQAAMTAAEASPVMLVTGASRGIGAAIARSAATAGYAVVVNYASQRRRRPMRWPTRSATTRSPCSADVGDEAAVLAHVRRDRRALRPHRRAGQQRRHRRRLRHPRHLHGRGARTSVGGQPDRAVRLRPRGGEAHARRWRAAGRSSTSRRRRRCSAARTSGCTTRHRRADRHDDHRVWPRSWRRTASGSTPFAPA